MTEITHRGEIVAENDKLSVVLCEACGFRHLFPIPDNSQLYIGGVYHRVLKPSMADDYGHDKIWWETIYGDWLTIARPYIPHPSLLDVGCGFGHFVRAAIANGLNAEGSDPAPLGNMNDVPIRQGVYSETVEGQYGCISAHWVLEHLPDPTHFVAWAHSRLLPKGVLMITIPNDFSFLQGMAAALVDRPFYWIDRTHINYWSAIEFASWLARHGFSVVASYGSWEPEYHLIKGKNYLDDPEIGKILHAARVHDDLSVSASYRRSKYILWGALGMGRDVTFFAVKKE